MGISVKSRSRDPRTGENYVRIPKDNLEKAKLASEAFGCTPHFAIVVDANDLIRTFIVSLEHLIKLFPPTRTSVAWKMTPRHIDRYYRDPHVMIFEMRASTIRWWKGAELSS